MPKVLPRFTALPAEFGFVLVLAALWTLCTAYLFSSSVAFVTLLLLQIAYASILSMGFKFEWVTSIAGVCFVAFGLVLVTNLVSVSAFLALQWIWLPEAAIIWLIFAIAITPVSGLTLVFLRWIR